MGHEEGGWFSDGEVKDRGSPSAFLLIVKIYIHFFRWGGGGGGGMSKVLMINVEKMYKYCLTHQANTPYP